MNSFEVTQEIVHDEYEKSTIYMTDREINISVHDKENPRERSNITLSYEDFKRLSKTVAAFQSSQRIFNQEK